MVIKNKLSKKMIAIILAVVLVVGTLPVGFASVFAAMKDSFKVEIEEYNYSAEITLTDTSNSSNTKTETAANGVATFDNFVDDEKTYNLKITELVGYKDYSYDGIAIEGNSIVVKKSDLTEIEKATATGKVVDEKGKDASGVKVTYSAYNDQIKETVVTNSTGTYSFDFYKDIDYSMSIKGEDKYVVKEENFKSSDNKDFGTHQLVIQQFAINVTVGSNGTASIPNALVNYGEDAPSIVINADKNYIISSLKIDGADVNEAVGQESYDVASKLKNITANHTVSVEFALDEIEVTFNISKTGKVEINDGTSVSTAGTVIVANGSDETPLTTTKKLLKGQTIQAVVSDKEKYHIESFKVGNEEKITSSNNDTHISPEYTFDKTKTTITVVFALDRYNITINAGENGTATADAKTVEYGSNSKITITPNDGFDVDSFSISKDPSVNVSSLSEIDNIYTFTISNVTQDITVDVSFKEVEQVDVADVLSNDLYTVSFSKTPIVIGNEYIVGNGESITVTPVSPYIRLRINGIEIGTSKTYTNSKNINKIEVSTKTIGGWSKSSSPNIKFVVDKNAPTISKPAKSPKKDFNNNSYKITTKVEDDYSGVDKVYFNTKNDFDTALVANYDESTKVATFTTTADEYNSKYYIWAVDKVGNKTTEKAVDIKIDNTKPTVDKFEFSSSSLNVYDFGTFSNSDITVKITASDKNSTVTNSGVETITFNGHTERVKSDGSAEFKLEASKFTSSKVSATATDFAGNTSQITVPTSDNSNIKSNLVTISTAKADVNISRKETAKYIDGEKYWYAKDTGFTVNVSDYFGIKKVVIQMNGKTVIDETLDESKSAINSKNYTINTSENAKDGENVITVDVVNVVNNATDTKTLSIYKDTKKPNVVNFEFKSKGTSVISKILNFLTFGNFFNEKVEITVKGNDEEASSGIKSVTLYGNEEKIDTQKCINGVATFEVPAEAITDETLHLNKTISARATDNVENVTQDLVYPTTTNSGTFKSSNLMIETIKPTAKITCPTPAQNKNPATDDGKDWYADDVDFTVAVSDKDSGIRNVVIKINGKAITSLKAKDSNEKDIEHTEYHDGYDENEAVVGYDYRSTKQTELKYVVNTKLATIADDGSYKIEVIITDNAGNVSETFTKTVYKDIDAPTIKDFKFEAKGYHKDNQTTSANSAPVVEKSYGFYFREKTTVTITADDIKPSSGVKSITYYTVDKSGGKSPDKSADVNSNNQIRIDIPANFKGQIYAKATDNVNNVAKDYVNPNGLIVENEEEHRRSSHIKYTLKETKDITGKNVVDSNGNNLYGADTTVDVEIADTYSGIRQIDWEIVAPYDDKKQAGTVVVDNNGQVSSSAKSGYSADCLGEWKEVTEDNLVTVLRNTITVSNNSNDIKIKFSLTDRAGNETKDVVQVLSIDKTAPKIVVQMNEDDDETYSGFFRGKRTADIYVYERNFASSDFAFNVIRTDDNDKESVVNVKPKFEKIGEQVIDDVECYVYKMSTSFSADGDYNFTVSAQDTAGHINSADSTNHKTVDKDVKYSSDKTDVYSAQNDADRAIDNVFTIDNTKPVIAVSYDNNDVRNEKYFNNHRVATITVKEHNFTSTDNRIVYTRKSTKDGASIEEPKVSAWSQNGNTYTATINYNADGDYTFAVDLTDKAGNTTKDTEVSYNGSASKDFVIDTTIDKPVISGVVNGNSYKESVLPKINFSDINFKNAQVRLLRTRKDEINKDVTNNYKIGLSTNQHGGSFNATEETFKKIQENDGIYTLSVQITDKAENTSSDEVTFTVNRFGSVYSLGKYLSNELNDKYVQSIDNDIVITEYNPDRLVKGGLDVVVTRDGSPVEYGDGELTISPVVNELAKIGSSGWYQYEYTISKNVFTDDNGNPIDGIYKVYVGSEDTVGNKSENISYDESSVLFRLDHTAPTIKSVSGLDKKIVNADEQKVSYEVFDAIGIDSIDVYYYDGNGTRVDHIRSTDKGSTDVTDILSDLTDYTGSFTIGSSTTSEPVRIVIKDLAGNVTDTDSKDFDVDSIDFNRAITVSTNFFVRWFANKIVFGCSIAAIIAVGGGLAFFIAIRKRRIDEAITEEIKKKARGSKD
ncbi:Ig-like domain repeat protein [uncultured Eubacterium sp.]|mgnify:CR=1 FL=1|uniref:InlB B-repeat-containing protein n=1 Tax=uncultured Eubacterium sp. TaxID=165185 RepID=UPI00260BC581|nr:Ig-like domain repeat protein [uncultured Eubacterium sp.]